ncbi:hypothetical protein FGO68_gene17180 [Halteria grandinella]|uniref:Uncharacterized protein n=1 Tax=Halteria grandinella TaxID=5974 RepID=A0A8J8NX51_HALGN|nr:hypothetical protein FGO68_gene17180 [Halteria grandinella]
MQLQFIHKTLSLNIALIKMHKKLSSFLSGMRDKPTTQNQAINDDNSFFNTEGDSNSEVKHQQESKTLSFVDKLKQLSFNRSNREQIDQTGTNAKKYYGLEYLDSIGYLPKNYLNLEESPLGESHTSAYLAYLFKLGKPLQTILKIKNNTVLTQILHQSPETVLGKYSSKLRNEIFTLSLKVKQTNETVFEVHTKSRKTYLVTIVCASKFGGIRDEINMSERFEVIVQQGLEQKGNEVIVFQIDDLKIEAIIGIARADFYQINDILEMLPNQLGEDKMSEILIALRLIDQYEKIYLNEGLVHRNINPDKIEIDPLTFEVNYQASEVPIVRGKKEQFYTVNNFDEDYCHDVMLIQKQHIYSELIGNDFTSILKSLRDCFSPYFRQLFYDQLIQIEASMNSFHGILQFVKSLKETLLAEVKIDWLFVYLKQLLVNDRPQLFTNILPYLGETHPLTTLFAHQVISPSCQLQDLEIYLHYLKVTGGKIQVQNLIQFLLSHTPSSDSLRVFKLYSDLTGDKILLKQALHSAEAFLTNEEREDPNFIALFHTLSQQEEILDPELTPRMQVEALLSQLEKTKEPTLITKIDQILYRDVNYDIKQTELEVRFFLLKGMCLGNIEILEEALQKNRQIKGRWACSENYLKLAELNFEKGFIQSALDWVKESIKCGCQGESFEKVVLLMIDQSKYQECRRNELKQLLVKLISLRN